MGPPFETVFHNFPQHLLALFFARSLIENSNRFNSTDVHVVALDWAMAFDSVSLEALCIALGRFGIPQAFVDMVGAIYTDRSFFIRDDGTDSAKHTKLRHRARMPSVAVPFYNRDDCIGP